MNKRTILIRTYIVLLVVGIAFAVFPTDWSDIKQIIAFIATFLGFILAGISLIIPTSYCHVIKESDWVESNNNDCYFIILKKTHSMGKTPKCIIYEIDENGYRNEIIVDNSYNDKGDIKIAVGRRQHNDIAVVVS